MSVINEIVKQKIQEWKTNLMFPLLIGLQGPQGCGKTTLCHELAKDPSLTILSLDDFYFPFTKQFQVREENPSNPLLEFRGNPGTHDLPLLCHILQGLLSGKSMQGPLYDKSLNQGRGDRRQETQELKPNSIILIEGWCVGFQPLPSASLSGMELKSFPDSLSIRHEDILDLNQHVEALNCCLALDALIQIKALELEFVYDWRWEQECHLIQKCGQGMSVSQVHAFVDRFIPAYQIYLPTLENWRIPHLQLTLDKQRNVVNEQTT